MSDPFQLQNRLAFIKLDEAAQARLAKAQPVIERNLQDSLEGFYAQVRQFPEVARFFAGERQISGAKNAQAAHWVNIASGRFDQSYVESVQRIGSTHARIGLEPRWYIGGYALVLEALTGAIVADHESRRPAWSRRDGGKELAATLGAVIKAAMLDMDFVISLYLEAAEVARREADERRHAAEIEQKAVVQATAAALSSLAEGDLTTRISAEFNGEYDRLKADFNGALEKLETAMAEVSANTRAMRSGVVEISQAAGDLSRRTEHQAATLEETAAALDQITVTVQKSADGAQRAAAVVTSTRTDGDHAAEVMARATAAMGEIERSANQISQIIGVIDEIAFQTNLLALNAGVEAARAGDAGRGFAVVASEVRALAQRSAEAAKEIKTLISASVRQIETGVSQVGETETALGAMVERVQEIHGLMDEITASAREQSLALGEINTAVNLMDQATQQNAAMVEQSTAASHALNSEAAELARLVERFRISAGESRAAHARTPVSAPKAPPALERLASIQKSLAERSPIQRSSSTPAARPALKPLLQEDDWESF